MLKTNTLRAKFLLSFVVLSLAYIAISSFFILNIVNSANNRMAKASFVRWASDFETMAEPNFIYFNYMNLNAQAEEILQGNDRDFIVLFDAMGKEIFFKGPERIRPDLEPFRADSGRAGPGGRVRRAPLFRDQPAGEGRRHRHRVGPHPLRPFQRGQRVRPRRAAPVHHHHLGRRCC